MNGFDADGRPRAAIRPVLLGKAPAFVLSFSVALVVAITAAGIAGAVVGRSVALRVAPAVVLGLFSAAAVVVVVRLAEELADRTSLLRSVEDWLGHDTVTGLVDRDGARVALRRHLGRGGDHGLVAVAIVRIDRLGAVNESIGYGDGNLVLATVAARLAGLAGVDDVARTGGGEFVVVAAGLPATADLERLADSVAAAAEAPIPLNDGPPTRVSVTVGLAWWSRVDDGEPMGPIELLRRADLAYEAARRRGGGIGLYDVAIQRRADAERELEDELRLALEEDRIEVHYQPVVNVVTGEVVAVEALVRWRDPVRDLVHPGDFLPVATRSRLIIDLGDRVLELAARRTAEWVRERGQPIVLATNVSGRQLADPTLAGRIESTMSTAGLDPRLLCLEVTERDLGGADEAVAATVDRLRAIGVTFVIDDFGTSQATLGSMRHRGPVSAGNPAGMGAVAGVKIDPTFVRNIAADEVDYKVVAAIVAVARSLDLEVTAEGVETVEQSQVLVQLGVERQQGFLFARPGPSVTVEALIVPARGGDDDEEPGAPADDTGHQDGTPTVGYSGGSVSP